MYQRHHVVGLLAVCLAGTIALPGAARQDKTSSAANLQNAECQDGTCVEGETPGCRKQVDRCDSLLRGGREERRVVYFRIAYDYDVDPLQKQAFQKGMEMWNRHSPTTGFMFEDAKADEQHDFRLQHGAPRHLQNRPELEKAECAAYASPGSYIWYSPQGMNWVMDDADIEAAGRVYAHELGHALNICHKPCSLLMRPGDSDKGCLALAARLPREIPKEDLRDARTCGHGARAKARADDELLEWAKQVKQGKPLEP
jgi:hypothetical protein